MYFSIALASCSRMRLAIGERAEAALVGIPREDDECDGTPTREKVLEELGCFEDGIRYDDDESGWEDDCDCKEPDCCPLLDLPLSRSPLSSVEVVRLPPEPLRMRATLAALISMALDGGRVSRLLQSCPLAAACAACAKILRAFLFSSYCVRAVSSKVSRM